MSNLLNTRNEVYGAMKSIMASSTRSESDFAKYEDLENQYRSLTKQIEAEVRFDSIKSSMDTVLDKRNVGNSKTSNEDEIRSAFLNYVRTGDVSEIRNINSFTSAEGGVNVPTILFGTIQKALADASVMRRIGAKVISTTSTTTLPLANTAPTALWKNQSNAPGDSGSYADTPQTFGSATLNAYKLTALMKISDELLQDASTDLEATVAQNVGTAFGNAEEIAFVSGSGVLQPTGLFRITAAGGNNVLTQNLGSASGSAAILDAMIDGYYKMPGNRRQEAVWVVGDALAAVMRKAKASTAGTYLWETSVQLGAPDLFLGRPVYTTQAAPTVWQSTAGVLGALVYPQHYVIGDRGGYQFQRLNELYAQEGNIGYRATKRTDAVLTDGNSLVKFIASAA
jgi:HK97 family phage major capsid protein